MTNKRIQKLYRPLNEEEFADQIDKMGEAHKKESLADAKKATNAQLAAWRDKYEKEHENDAYMKDALIAQDIERHFPYENHKTRWQKQHKVAVELDAVNDELRKYGQGQPEYEDLMAKRLALESLL